MARARWIVPAVVVVGTWIGMLWLGRPQWGFCVDGIDAAHSFCDSGVYSLGAQAGTAGLIVLLAAYIALVVAVRGPRRSTVLTVAAGVLAVACLASVVVLFGVTEPMPFPLP